MWPRTPVQGQRCLESHTGVCAAATCIQRVCDFSYPKKGVSSQIDVHKQWCASTHVKTGWIYSAALPRGQVTDVIKNSSAASGAAASTSTAAAAAGSVAGGTVAAAAGGTTDCICTEG
eukprot:1250091-Lingulodinium_polyedra.AAC.1